MTQSWRDWGWKVGLASWLAIGGAIATSVDSVFAQNITLDGTLGATGALTGPDYVIPQAVGQTVDSNLFHSFGEFSLDTGESVGFQSAANIRNILSRVTGGFPSLIDGLIYTESTNVNLFLINPNGIIFGPNARLDVGSATRGSFVATTVDALVWPNGSQFSATNPGGVDSLLTIVGDPSGFISSLRQPEPIESTGSTLSVDEGQSLLLLGGKVSFDGGNLQAPGGRVELGALAGEGMVELNADGSSLSLSFPDGVERASISLTNRATVDVVDGGGGSIALNARNLNILGGSRLRAGIGEGLGSVGTQAGDITLNATEEIKIGQSSRIFSSGIENNVNLNATGNGGDINIQARSLNMTDGAQLRASTVGQGNAGSISIQVEDEVSLSSQSYIDSSAGYVAIGNGGDIQIRARSLSMTEARLGASTTRSQIRDTPSGEGDGGNISVQVEGAIKLIDSSIDSIVGSQTIGNGGDIHLKAGSLSMTDEAIVSTRTNGQGDAGNISIQVEGAVSLTTSHINSIVNFAGKNYRAVGDGGNIQIEAGSLTMTADARLITRSGAGISASTLGTGDAGNIFIQVEDMLSLSSTSYIASNVNNTAEGDGGEIQIKAGSLSMTDDARLSTSTDGQGNAGSISLQVEDEIFLKNSSIDSDVGFFRAVGDSGNIQLEARSLLMTDDAQLSSSTVGQGAAGDIKINAFDSVSISGVRSGSLPYSSGLFTTTEETAIGQGGDIEVNTNALHISDRALLSARTRNAFRGGNITINANTLEVTSGGQLITTAFSSGEAGDITVNSIDSITISGGDPTPTFGNRFAISGGRRVFSNNGSVSGLFAQTQDAGAAGDLKLTTRQLTVQDKAQVSASTSGTGSGGSLSITAPESVTLSNAQLSVEATAGGTAGDLNVETGKMTVSEGAQVTVSSPEGQAGNLTIRADSLFLNQGKLSAVAGISGTPEGGANINLQNLDLLLLSNESLISANALDEANGGNITINSTFIIATPPKGLEGSDIIANAQLGNGGRISITTQGIYGIEFRPERTPDNDATVSSEFGLVGEFLLNTPGIDPSRGLTALPVVPTSEAPIAQSCPSADKQNTFTVTGRGGLPPQPGEALRTEAVRVNGDSREAGVENRSTEVTSTIAGVEAQGWVVNAQGEVVLTASAPTITPNSSWFTPPKCHAS